MSRPLTADLTIVMMVAALFGASPAVAQNPIIDQGSADPSVKAVVITGNDQAFAAGADVTEFAPNRESARLVAASFRTAGDAIAAIPREPQQVSFVATPALRFATEERVRFGQYQVLDEELPRRVHQHRMQLRRDGAAGGKAEVVAELVEDRQQRLVPAALIDLDPALGDLPRVSDPPVEKRLLPVPVASLPTHPAQLPRLCRRHGKLDRPHTAHLEV